MKKILVFLTFSGLMWLACTRDNFMFTSFECSDDITYDNQIKDIIATNGSYGACHNGTPGVPGVYTTYRTMLADLEIGSIKERVIDRVADEVVGMPPNYAEGPTDLTDEEFMLISCWLDNNYPE